LSDPSDLSWTIRRVLAWTTERFRKGGLESARLDAELLLAHTLATDRLHLYCDLDKPLAPPELSRFRDQIRRRLQGEPVAYLTGRREFWSLPLAVDGSVLVPRPETELLVEVALSRVEGHEEVLLVDVGAGSGAVAIALAHELPRARVFAIEKDESALSLSRQNLEQQGKGIILLEGDLLQPLPLEVIPDLVVANLPYIPSAEIERLSVEVRRWEPRIALDGGPDGLEIIRRLIPQAEERLTPGGWLALEMGHDQGDRVRELLLEHGFIEIEVHQDLQGLDRVVVARKPSRL
jgi:release factor glutamine methyltransferase